MNYKVINYFTDLQDFNHPYNVGDVFPRNGLKVSESRILELSTANNKQGKPLIECVDVKKDFSNGNLKKTEIYKMSTAELRKFAKDNGIGNADEMTGVELKKILVSKLGM